jgi:hypothetical protein
MLHERADAILRHCAKALLCLVTCAIPVFIAACYGGPVGSSEPCQGKVVDKTTNVGIAGIEIRCMVAGSAYDAGWSASDGSFNVSRPTSSSCDSLVALDVDGSSNGSYRSTSVSLAGDVCGGTIELEGR